MASVLGLGGAFLRAEDAEALYTWYAEHLGMTRSAGGFVFASAQPRGDSVLAFLGRDDSSFPPAQPVMIDLQVDDLDGVLDRLEAAGAAVDPNRMDSEFGRFGWFTTPRATAWSSGSRWRRPDARDGPAVPPDLEVGPGTC